MKKYNGVSADHRPNELEVGPDYVDENYNIVESVGEHGEVVFTYDTDRYSKDEYIIKQHNDIAKQNEVILALGDLVLEGEEQFMASKQENLNKIIDFYAEAVRQGKRGLDDVPTKIREQVKARLESLD